MSVQGIAAVSDDEQNDADADAGLIMVLVLMLVAGADDSANETSLPAPI